MKQLEFLDILTIMSFCIALQNLDLNISQEDIQASSAEIEKTVNERLEKALEDIHGHLSVQDTKLSLILQKLEDM
jgi:hypothetical protein